MLDKYKGNANHLYLAVTIKTYFRQEVDWWKKEDVFLVSYTTINKKVMGEVKSVYSLTSMCFVYVSSVPPDAVVSGYDQSWSVNRKGAELKCEGAGNPQPHSFTWTRYLLPASRSVRVCVFAQQRQKPVFPAVMSGCLCILSATTFCSCNIW